MSEREELRLFEAWASKHLGQGYPLTMEEDLYDHPVTRWAFKAFKAGRKTQDQPKEGSHVQA